MERKNRNRLNPTKSLIDYANPTRILKAYDNDIKAIREDYSRYRSIIRKRLDRMEQAGETYNPYYNYYKDRDESLPSARGLSDTKLMKRMASLAAGVSGAYQDTVSEIRASRADALTAWKGVAEAENDEELASYLDEITPEQLAEIGRIMGMITFAVGVKGKLLDSSGVYQEAMKAVLNQKNTKSLLSKAANIINDMGLDDSDDTSALEKMKTKYNWHGEVKVSYKKAHQKRGK